MPLWMTVLLAFLSGSVPYAVLVGYLVLHTDIRQYGDGNPGAYNVFRAGGRLSGLVAGLLDAGKAAAPTWLALRAYGPVAVPWVAVAAVAGHAFSPWLRFRGGKAIAASLGIWLALLTVVPAFWILAAALIFWLLVVKSHPWVVTLGFGCLGLWLVWKDPVPWLLATWAGDMAVLLWKHRHALREEPPVLRPWLRRRIPFSLGR